MSTTARVLLGLFLGALIGLGLAWWDTAIAGRVADAVQPVGRMWLNALQMTVVPLVAALVILGVNTARDAAASGRTARRAIACFVVLLAAGAALAAVAAPLLLSLLPRPAGLAESLRASAAGEAGLSVPGSLSDWFAAVIPSNAIAAAAQSAMLPLVVFALFFGFALAKIEDARRARLLELVQAVADVMIVIVRWVLWAAPLGVFALVLAVCARVGGGMLGAFGTYIGLQIALYLAMTLLLYPIAVVFGGERLRRFALAILPAQTIAASTQSSLVSLPAMLESARTRLGYPLATTSLVLPMAVSLFRITSPMQYIGVACFIAWAYGVELSAAQLAAGAALAVVISMGSVGLPGQVSFMATNMPVTQAMGLPVEPLGLLLALDTVPDVFATLGNVTADLTATSVVARGSSDPTPEAPSPGASQPPP
ncbi:dicarboxylate/amino acid:cation symporter [Vulcaniibacterium tengchongense]|uniref:Na+/H+-dicarboxylate symporter n=1 Tax=Vulcaniibacterium tengchongense TaxID=1273429 RepID=A0A3N4V293_9GAMM|nr:dicarboxylate/amino acid:cation symporter [Vulcaniibacterium tengchongense]RPE77056.1 Na+/H+-dicarboxylate symporter [Vulcaniibacterium tengchongense]